MDERGLRGVGAAITVSVGLLVFVAAGGCGSKGGAASGSAGGPGGVAATGSAGSAAGSGGSAAGSGGSAGSAGSAGKGGGAAGSSGTISSGESVLMHHRNPNRDGVYVQPTLTKAAVAASFNKDTGFNAILGTSEAVYAQALFVDGAAGGSDAGGRDLVIVATEQDNVYALDATTGAQVWVKSLGSPVPRANLACGNIDPYGVTGTPVIDFASRTLFVDAMTTPDGGTTTKHLIFALSIDDGSIKTGWPVDVEAKLTNGTTVFYSSSQSQRGALAVLDGTLYVPYGGFYGDCGSYHGWLVAVSISNPSQVQAWATSLGGGGSWGPGGVASEGSSVYITTGNTFGGTTTWGGGEGLLRFTPGASFATPTFWAAANWLTLDSGDLDVGGSGVVLLDLAGASPSTLALALGKDGNAYLLDRNNLSGVAPPTAMAQVSRGQIINAPAVYTTATGTRVVFKGAGTMCTTSGDSFASIKIVPGSPPTIEGSWCAEYGGNGSPMVTTSDGHADAIVWVMGVDTNSSLNALDGETGALIAYPGMSVTVPGMRTYNTPIAAKGRIYVPADGTVVAFKLN
jgi:hypothetical protein